MTTARRTTDGWLALVAVAVVVVIVVVLVLSLWYPTRLVGGDRAAAVDDASWTTASVEVAQAGEIVVDAGPPVTWTILFPAGSCDGPPQVTVDDELVRLEPGKPGASCTDDLGVDQVVLVWKRGQAPDLSAMDIDLPGS